MDYNVLEEIDNLIKQGYSEEHAEEVAMLNNYDIPLEEMYSSSETHDYSPSMPWDAPGMCISDFI